MSDIEGEKPPTKFWALFYRVYLTLEFFRNVPDVLRSGQSLCGDGEGKDWPQLFQKTDGMCSSECWAAGLSQIPPLPGSILLAFLVTAYCLLEVETPWHLGGKRC